MTAVWSDTSASKLHSGKEWKEEVESGPRLSSRTRTLKGVDSHSPVPWVALTRFAEAAKKQAQIERLGSGRWLAQVAECPGVWADGASSAQARDNLDGVLIDWALVKIADHDRDFPVFPGVFDLNKL